MAKVDNKPKFSNGRIMLMSFGVVAGMIGLTFAAVPLYTLICQVTGYGGTITKREASTATADAREINVRFDSNTSQGLEWKFWPEVKEVRVKVGETVMVHYKARNLSDKPIVGTSTYNVVPFTTGPYFAKVECFCFTEQLLMPGEEVSMPVSFYVDPEIFDDDLTEKTRVITLSYTFFPAKDQSKAMTSAARAPETGTKSDRDNRRASQAQGS